VQQECFYSERIVNSIGSLLRTEDGLLSIVSSGSAFIQVVEPESKIIVFGVHLRGAAGSDAVRDVIDKIDFGPVRGDMASLLNADVALRNLISTRV
jgi:hypothetical protein